MLPPCVRGLIGVVMNSEQLNQNRRTEPGERWNAAAMRRADAMHVFSDQTMRKGVDEGERTEPEFPRHAINTSDLRGVLTKHVTEADRKIYSPHASIRSQEPRAEWLRAVEIVGKHWRTSALFAVVVLGSAVLYLLITNPLFEPQARLEVDPPGAEVFSLQGNQNGGAATDYMETQAQNLQNDELTIEVIRKLHLDKNPYFGGNPNSTGGSETESAETTLPLTPAESRALSVFKQSRRVTRDVASRLITVSVAAPDPVMAATVTNA